MVDILTHPFTYVPTEKRKNHGKNIKYKISRTNTKRAPRTDTRRTGTGCCTPPGLGPAPETRCNQHRASEGRKARTDARRRGDTEQQRLTLSAASRPDDRER
jgi:hypothetical protein